MVTRLANVKAPATDVLEADDVSFLRPVDDNFANATWTGLANADLIVSFKREQHIGRDISFTGRRSLTKASSAVSMNTTVVFAR